MTYYPTTWNDYLNCPIFVVTLSRFENRWKITEKRIKEKKFTNVNKFNGVDYKIDNLDLAWKKHGSPYILETDFKFKNFLSKQGNLISQLNCLKHAIDNEINFFTIAEDDILFHPYFDFLAPAYYENTPKDFDLCYGGCNTNIVYEYDGRSVSYQDRKEHILKIPSMCTHYIMYTLEGAKKIYNFLLHDIMGNHCVETIDCRLWKYQYDMIYHPSHNFFNWYVWNVKNFENVLNSIPKNTGYINFNFPEYSILSGEGLVLQDQNIPSITSSSIDGAF